MPITEAKKSRVDVAGHIGPVPPKPEEFKFVKYRIDGGVARLTLDRPEHNLLNERMLAELAVGIDSLEGRGDVKLIVLSSKGNSFCGGIELGEYTPKRVFQVLDAFQRTFAAMLDTAKPLLVVVNGPAFGGGAELAALGDLVVATPNAQFAQPEIKLGVFPPLGAAILPYIVGPKRALELVLTGEVISAERALGLGLVNRVVPENKLDATVKEMIAQVTAHSGPVLTMAKKAILGSMGLSLREGVRQSMSVFLNELSAVEDSNEGLRAIAEKRTPQWKNR
jgi:cyclohexa-1,5-dienecarbonyl-CoA hydratase